MSAAFATQLRAGGRPPIELASGSGTITIRVEAAELWDAVQVVARGDTPVSEVKQRAVALFYPDAQYHEDLVLKLRGWEILDEHASLTEAGVQDGSILLLAYRRRRPIR